MPTPKVALRRQQAQEEAEARELGVPLLRPADSLQEADRRSEDSFQEAGERRQHDGVDADKRSNADSIHEAEKRQADTPGELNLHFFALGRVAGHVFRWGIVALVKLKCKC